MKRLIAIFLAYAATAATHCVRKTIGGRETLKCDRPTAACYLKSDDKFRDINCYQK